jgi:hypothetical protein
VDGRWRFWYILDFNNMDVDTVVLGVVPSKRVGEDSWCLTPPGQKAISKAITKLEVRMVHVMLHAMLHAMLHVRP